MVFSVLSELVTDLTEKAVSPKAGRILATVCIVSCVLMNGSVIIGAIIEISHIMSVYFGRPQLFFKLMIICVYFILSALIIEPEKLKPYAFLSSGVVIFIGKKKVKQLF